MRLIYIANYRIPTQKAYGVQIIQMCKAFAQLDHVGRNEITLLYPHRRNHIKESIERYYRLNGEFEITELYSPDFYFPGFLDRLAFFIKSIIAALRLTFHATRKKPDIIYSRDELSIYFLTFFQKRPLVIFEAHRFKDRMKWMYHRVLRKDIRIVTISKAIKERFLEIGFDGSRVFVASDAVNLKDFNIEVSRYDCRRKLQLPADRKIIGYVGQMRIRGKEKGVDVLIKAFRLLREKNKSAALLFVGGSPLDDKEYSQLIKPEDIDEGNIIIAGQKEPWTIPYYLKACDVLTIPFGDVHKNEDYALYSSPMKTFEYMASGTPIVATDIPSISEILNSGNAYMVKPNDPKLLSYAIDRVFGDQMRTQEKSKKALKEVSSMTWSNRAADILGFVAEKTRTQV